MKIVTANRLSDGRVIYVGANDQPVEHISQAAVFDDEGAEFALAAAQANPGVFVGPYIFETEGHIPSGRDRLKERIRSAGPTVGNSLKAHA
ncbi:MAG: DUF2849 domain-containing protein [Brevundimonas sp.]|nr:MAG: DUF2849 domain-containing protein [Brevundimonas sp.]